MDRDTRKRGAEMAIEERGAVMCRERERGRTDAWDLQREREREEEQIVGKRRGFFFMNKQMLEIATVLPNALGRIVAIPGNI
jgi:hypothetical protein